MDATIAAAFAAAAPAYVRASPVSWQVVDSATGEVAAERTSLLEAATLAAERCTPKRDASGQPLRILRGDSGEPDGAWRFLPAAAAEDEPNAQDGVRLTERSIWQLAAKLNARSQPIPIDGGPGSVVHGTAHDSATPANGYAHHGVVVYDSEARASLYLRAELVTDVATEIDRGRLAYGSIHFWTSDALDETGAPDSAELISFGLTNTPADQRITPASAVRAAAPSTHARVASRTRRLTRAAPAAPETSMGTYSKKDLLAALDEIKGNDVTVEQLEAVLAGKAAAAGKTAEEAPAEEVAKSAAEAPPADAARTEAPVAPPAADAPAKRAVAGIEDPAALEAWAMAALDCMRSILGKPDADAPAALTEMQAMQDRLAAAAGSAGTAPADGTPADQQGAEARELEAEVSRCRKVHAKPAASTRELLEHQRKTIERNDHERWLVKAIADRKLAVPDKERGQMLDDCCAYGRDVVERSLNLAARPPSGSVMRQSLPTDRGAQPETFIAAVNACMPDAIKAGKTDEPAHFTRARAQRLALERFPHLAEQPADAS